MTGGGPWVDVGTIASPLDQPNTHGTRSFTDTTFPVNANVYYYRVVAQNTIGYGGEFMSLTAESVSDPVLRGPGAHQPGGDAAGRPAGQPDLDRQHRQRDRL